MKIRHILVIAIFLIHIPFLSNMAANDYTQWNLPEGAKARLGKGWINSISFFARWKPNCSSKFCRYLDLRRAYRC